MSYGNKYFTGSLVQPLVQPTGSAPLLPGPTTVVGGSETFVMNVQDSSDNSIQVNVINISVAAITATVTQSSGVNTTTGNLTIATGSTWSGVLVRATSSGTLPTGIAGATNYYAYNSSLTTVQLFDTLAHMLLAQAQYNSGPAAITAAGLIIPSAIGSGTMTLTPTALGTTTYKLQGSNDYVPSPIVVGSGQTNASGLSSSGAPTALNAGNWFDLVAGESPSGIVTNTITTASTTSRVNSWSCGYAYIRILFSVGAGTAQVQVIGHN